jgi:FkbM family methyltransferase
MKNLLTSKLTVYKNDLKTKGIYWSIIHRLYKIPFLKRVISPIVNFCKPSFIRIQKHKIFIDKSDQVVSQALLLYKTWEPFQTRVFLEHINKGDFVVDIGAHIGYYTLYAAYQAGEKGSIYAFEPDPKNYALLQKNVKKNKYSNVSLQNSAISNINQTQILYTDSINSGDHRLYKIQEKRAAILVKTVTLDTFFKKEKAKIDLIKLDIQGHEYNALLGAQTILHYSKNLKIITEFYPKGLYLSGSSPQAYLNLLTTYGFYFYEISEKEEKLLKVTTDQLLRKYTKSSEQFTNLFCIKGSS